MRRRGAMRETFFGIIPAAAALTLAAVLSPAASPAMAQEDPHKAAVTWYQQGMTAYKAKDYVGFLEGLKKAAELFPEHPALQYRLACASALVGNKEDAITHLRRVVEMKVYYDLADNADFDTIRSAPEFQAVATEMKALKTHVGSSKPAFRLTQKDLIVEGVAYDATDGMFYVGSVHRRKILRVSRKGKAADFAGEKQDGLGAVLGLKVDARRHHLWACTSGVPQMTGATEEEKGKAALHKYDLSTGAFVAKYPLGGGAAGHNCNDLVVGTTGDVYVSDAESGEILVLAAGAAEFRTLIEAGQLRSPQGLALSPDDKILFAADYGGGLYRIDPATRVMTPLHAGPTVALIGIDGLLFHRNTLIAIQNGINPHRVVRLTLTPALDRIESAKILEMNNPLFDEPTLGTVADDDLYYVANSQWGRFNPDGTIYPDNRLAEPVILKMRLD